MNMVVVTGVLLEGGAVCRGVVVYRGCSVLISWLEGFDNTGIEHCRLT